MFRIEENFGEATEPEEIAKARGTVWVNGKGPNLDGIVLNKLNNTIKLKATQQTSPGNAKQLRFKVWTGPRVKPSGADVPGMFGDRFSVAAIPIGMTEKYLDDNVGADLRGFRTETTFVSDSGNFKDLDKAFYWEKLRVTKETGTLKNLPQVKQEQYDTFNVARITDTHGTVVDAIKANGGERVVLQLHWFKDDRTGAKDITIPHSGYKIVREVFQDGTQWKLRLTKTGQKIEEVQVENSTTAAGGTKDNEPITKDYAAD